MTPAEITKQIEDSLIKDLSLRVGYADSPEKVKKMIDEFYPKNSASRVVCATCDCNMAFIVRYESYDLSFRCFICEDEEKENEA